MPLSETSMTQEASPALQMDSSPNWLVPNSGGMLFDSVERPAALDPASDCARLPQDATNIARGAFSNGAPHPSLPVQVGCMAAASGLNDPIWLAWRPRSETSRAMAAGGRDLINLTGGRRRGVVLLTLAEASERRSIMAHQTSVGPLPVGAQGLQVTSSCSQHPSSAHLN